MKTGFLKTLSLTAALCMIPAFSFAQIAPSVHSNTEKSDWITVADHKLERGYGGLIAVTVQYPLYDIAPHALQSARIENYRNILKSLQNESSTERDFMLKNLDETESLIHEGHTDLIGNYFLTAIEVLRDDSVLFSVLEHRYLNDAAGKRTGYGSMNFDGTTGKPLTIFDVTTLSQENLSNLLTAALHKKYPDAPFHNASRSLHDFLLRIIDNDMLLEQGPFTWTLDKEKLSFYFDEGENFSNSTPSQLDFPYKDYPELFKKKYLPPEK